MDKTSKELTLELNTQVVDQRPVYITGNFNNWKETDDRFRMQQTGPGQYVYRFPGWMNLPNPLEYKYIKGNFDNIELDSSGHLTNNRSTIKRGGVKRDKVPNWKLYGRSYNPATLPKIQKINEPFLKKYLGEHRSVNILLPHDYYTSGKSYSVLYMHDGQNLFDEKAPFGTWGIDKCMSLLSDRGMDFIVVSIDHAGVNRIKEYSPYRGFSMSGTGDGKKYLAFIAEDLKPYIDIKFRTLADRQFTGIGGSSMGGLISIYAGLVYSHVFGRFMVFSPSLWMAPKIYYDAANFYPNVKSKMYLYAGGRESRTMIPNTRNFKESLTDRTYGLDPFIFKLSVDSKGRHNEAIWGKEFPKAVEWLFFR